MRGGEGRVKGEEKGRVKREEGRVKGEGGMEEVRMGTCENKEW